MPLRWFYLLQTPCKDLVANHAALFAYKPRRKTALWLLGGRADMPTAILTSPLASYLPTYTVVTDRSLQYFCCLASHDPRSSPSICRLVSDELPSSHYCCSFESDDPPSSSNRFRLVSDDLPLSHYFSCLASDDLLSSPNCGRLVSDDLPSCIYRCRFAAVL